MARPIVLVYQEYENPTITPDVPDLNCLLVGPAYHIQDYLGDKTDIRTATDYGTLNADNAYIAPAAATDAITVAEPPNNSVGAILDFSSVKVYFDEARVLITEDVTTGANVTLNSNVVTGAGGTTFVTDGVKTGDYIIIQDPAGGSDLPKTVLAVDSETTLRTTTNFAQLHTGLTYRIEREVNDVEINSTFVTGTGNQVIIAGGVTTMLTGESVARTVNYAKVYVQYRSLRQDLHGVIDTVSDDKEIKSKIGKIDSRNPLAATAYATVKNTTTTIQFYGVTSDDSAGHSECMEFIESRKDIYAVVPLTTSLSIIQTWKVNAEQLASVDTAIQTGVPQKLRVILGSYKLPTTKTVSAYKATGSHKSVDTVPVAGTPIVAVDDVNVFVDMAATFVTAGVRAGDTLVIADDASREGSYPIAEVYDEHRLRTDTAFPAAANASARYYIIRGNGTPEATLPASWSTGSTTAPNTITTSLDRSAGVVDEYLGKVVHLTGGVTTSHLVTASTKAVNSAFTAYPVVATASGVNGTVVTTLMSVTTARAVTTRQTFRVLLDNAAQFITDGVVPGDVLQIPNPLTGTDFNTVTPYSYTVAYVPNENQIILAGGSDMAATNMISGDTALHYRMSRTLTKDDQVTELGAIAASLKSSRVAMVWPDSVEVTDLPDGSKTRAVASTPEKADNQPGYFLAAVVGAMTAGLPSHQGFTNISIAGIEGIEHASRYFSDTQLTTLSNSGWYVFAQTTENTAPYCIHQLMTDAAVLETGEYSLVKNFDYISLFFQDILDDYVGPYNITAENLGLLHQALDTGIDILKLRRFPKIGAPINSASVVSVEESSAAADRVEINMDINMPKPLNTIGLHLVSQ